MRVPELLAPAGGLDALLCAVAAGADAVYTGLRAFNARVSAQGLSVSELRRGCAFAHAHGARVYVTLNVFVTDWELADAVSTAKVALEAGADALIVADAGLVCAIGEALPGSEVHLSTQAGAHSPEALRLASRELGVERVTVARELPLPELAALCETGVPVEAFVHGAICICYSGACSYSALRRGRSAMRGDCTQPCRTSFGLEDAEGRERARTPGDKLLCPRDYLGIAHVAELARMDVASLKIEGRMKNPDYVYNVVGAYRKALDAVAAGEPVDAPALTERLARSFNRGFSEEYLLGRSGAALMSFERSCNQGVRVGRLVSCGRDEVEVGLCADVACGDTLEIRFYPGENALPDVPKRWPMVPCPRDAAAGERIRVRCKRKVEPGCEVYAVRSVRVLDGAARALEAARAEERMLNGGTGTGSAPEDEPVAPAWDPARSVRAAGTDDDSPCVPVAFSPAEAERLLARGTEVAVYAWIVTEEPDAWEPLLPRLTLILDEMLRAGEADRTGRLARAARRAVCRNIGQVELLRGLGIRFDVGAPLFCANGRAAAFFRKLGAERIWLADELGPVPAGCEGVAVRPRGPRELMVLEHCLFTAEGPCAGACAACPRRQAERYLVDRRDGARHAVRVDAHGRTRIFEAASTQDKLA